MYMFGQNSSRRWNKIVTCLHLQDSIAMPGTAADSADSHMNVLLATEIPQRHAQGDMIV